MKRFYLVLVFMMMVPEVLVAAKGGTDAQYAWVRETKVKTSARTQLSLGLLDRGLTGSRGTPIITFFEVNYLLVENFGVNIGLPLAGTLSGGNDSYGIGNVVLGGKYGFALGAFDMLAGLDIALPSASSQARVGGALRQFTLFVQDQVAITPYLAVAFVKERLAATLNLGTNVQIFTDTAGGVVDRLEDVFFYDLGFAHSIIPNLWAVIEFGGYTTISYSSNTTQLFAGPGIRYQDDDLSAGIHLVAPFRSPSKDIIDFLMLFEFRVFF